MTNTTAIEPKAPGDRCPECGTSLVYEPPENRYPNEPDIDDAMWCPSCGLDWPVEADQLDGPSRNPN